MIKRIIFMLLLLSGYAYAEIEVTGKFAPKNDGFTGLVDDEQILDSGTTSGNILVSDGVSFSGTDPSNLCEAITGSADLCDGDDATGAGGTYSLDDICDNGATTDQWITVNGLTSNDDVNVATGKDIRIGTTQWNSGDTIDGEQIKNDTIDNDSIDWADMTDLTTDGAVLWGNLAEGELTDSSIITADIKDDTISMDDLADDCIGVDQLADGDYGDVSFSGGVISFDADTVSSAEMADDDHGDVSWENGQAKVEDIHCTDCITLDNIADDVTAETKCVYFDGEPGTNDDKYDVFPALSPDYTIKELWCKSDGAIYVMAQLDDGSPSSIDSTFMLCDSTPAHITSPDGDTGFASGETINIIIDRITQTGATYLNFCWEAIKDD